MGRQEDYERRLGRALENATEKLPPDWSLTLCISNVAFVALDDPRGIGVDPAEFDRETLPGRIDAAVEVAAQRAAHEKAHQ